MGTLRINATKTPGTNLINTTKVPKVSRKDSSTTTIKAIQPVKGGPKGNWNGGDKGFKGKGFNQYGGKGLNSVEDPYAQWIFQVAPYAANFGEVNEVVVNAPTQATLNDLMPNSWHEVKTKNKKKKVSKPVNLQSDNVERKEVSAVMKEGGRQ